MAGEDIERLRQAALKDPGQLVKLADALVAHDRAEEAVQACRRGLSARPDDIPLRLALGRALSAAGQLEEARAALLDAVSRQKSARDGGTAPRPPKPAPAPTPMPKLKPMNDTVPSLTSFDGEDPDAHATGVMSRPPSYDDTLVPRGLPRNVPTHPPRREEFHP